MNLDQSLPINISYSILTRMRVVNDVYPLDVDALQTYHKCIRCSGVTYVTLCKMDDAYVFYTRGAGKCRLLNTVYRNMTDTAADVVYMLQAYAGLHVYGLRIYQISRAKAPGDL
jgi:hypothetical protein